MLKILAPLATAISLYGPMLHTHHQIISPNYYPHFLLIIKVFSCLATFCFSSEQIASEGGNVNEKTKKDSSQDQIEQEEKEKVVSVAKAIGKLAPSMLFVSLLYLYCDFFTSRLLLPISPFAVVSNSMSSSINFCKKNSSIFHILSSLQLKRALYSLVYIFSLSFQFHLFIYSPVKILTRNIFPSSS